MRKIRTSTRIPFCVMRALAWIFQRLSHRHSLFLGEKIGDLFRIALRSKRSRMHGNLESAFPTLRGTPEILRLERECFRHYGKLGAEFLRFPVLTDTWLRENVTLEGLEYVRTLLEQKKGILSFIAHFGNWELISKRLALDLATPIHVVTRKIRDPKVDFFIRDHRALHGGALSISAEEDGIRPILAALKRNEIVVLALDQSAKPPEGISCSFFGRSAGTHASAARISMKLGIPLLPAFDARISRSKHHVRFGPSLCYSESSDQTMSPLEKIQWMTSRCTALIEERIREHPEQWIWMHNRWKYSPAFTQ